MWAVGKAFAGLIFPPATEFINRWMGAVPGNISDCAMGSRLAPSSLILRIPIAFSPACLVIPTDPMPSVACFVRLMAAPHGTKLYIKTEIPVRLIWSSIRLTLKLFMRTCGLPAARLGPQGILTAAPEAACTNLQTAGVRGNNGRKACPHGTIIWAASDSE